MAEDELASRRLAFYEACVGAWVQTSLELDRSLLTLSVAGLGLLVTLLTTHMGPGTRWLLCAYVVAILALATCCLTILTVFHQNQNVLEETLENEQRTQEEAADSKAAVVAARLDFVAHTAFGIGASCLAIIGITLATQSYEAKHMSSKKISNIGMDSMANVTKMHPELVNKSFNGVQNLAPKPAAPSTTTQTTQTVTQTTQTTTTTTVPPAPKK